MKNRIHVKPVGNKWGVFEFNIFENFNDDLYRYGMKIALYNFFFILFKRNAPPKNVI